MLWLHRLEADLDNLRTALEWSLGGGADDLLGLRLVGALGHFWFRQGHHAEGQQWVERALEKSGDAPLSVRAALHRTKSLLLAHTIDHVISFGNIHEALSLYKEIGDKREIGWTLIHLSLISAEHLDDIDEALALSEEGLALLQEVNDIPGIAQALNILGELYRLQGDLERAEVAYEETLAIAREIGDQLREALQGLNLGFIAYRRGQAGRALTLMQKSLALGLKLDHKAYIACTLEALAGPIGALGQTERAARLIGAGDAMNDALGISRQPTDAQELDRIGAAVRQAMDEDAFQIAKAEGRTLSYQEVIALAMDEPNEN
jgi:tetratricopeptide (TPR) repeat protein